MFVSVFVPVAKTAVKVKLVVTKLMFCFAKLSPVDHRMRAGGWFWCVMNRSGNIHAN